MNYQYQHLASSSAPFTSLLYGDDVSKNDSDIDSANKVGNNIRRVKVGHGGWPNSRGFKRGRGRGGPRGRGRGGFKRHRGRGHGMHTLLKYFKAEQIAIVLRLAKMYHVMYGHVYTTSQRTQISLRTTLCNERKIVTIISETLLFQNIPH